MSTVSEPSAATSDANVENITQEHEVVQDNDVNMDASDDNNEDEEDEEEEPDREKVKILPEGASEDGTCASFQIVDEDQ